MILAACAGDYVARGYFATQAFGGINLALRIAPLTPPDIPGFDPVVTAQTYEVLRPLRASEQASTGWESDVLVSALLYNFGKPVLAPALALVQSDPARFESRSPYWREIGVNRAAEDFSQAVIAREPVRYAWMVIRQFYGLWFIPHLARPGTIDAVADIMVNIDGLDRVRQVDSQVKPISAWLWFVKMAVFALMLMASLAVIVLALIWRDKTLRGLAYLSLGMNCYFGVIALLEVSLPRYSLMMWPFQCAILLGLILFLWRSRITPGMRRDD